MTAPPPPGRAGTYLQVYPSTLVGASRMEKVARSIHREVGFARTDVVGMRAPGLPQEEELAPGVSVVRIGGSRRTGTLGRVLRHLAWQPAVYARYRKARPTLVAAHNVWVLPLCALLAERAGAPLVYNAHELETETPGMRGLKQWAARTIERRRIRRCAVVSVVSGPIADWYASTYGIDRPLVVANIPEVVEAEVGLRRRLGVRDDEMLYVHTGHLTGARNIPLILEAFASSPHHVAFLGDGPLRPDVEEAAAAHPNIHRVDPVASELVVANVREADVGLCLIEIEVAESDRFAAPNKLFEALAAGVPALCSDLDEARHRLGPLADDWLLADPRRQLPEALARIGKAEVAEFQASYPGLGTWDDEIVPLGAACRRIIRLTDDESEGTSLRDPVPIDRGGA